MKFYTITLFALALSGSALANTLDKAVPQVMPAHHSVMAQAQAAVKPIYNMSVAELLDVALAANGASSLFANHSIYAVYTPNAAGALEDSGIKLDISTDLGTLSKKGVTSQGDEIIEIKVVSPTGGFAYTPEGGKKELSRSSANYLRSKIMTGREGLVLAKMRPDIARASNTGTVQWKIGSTVFGGVLLRIDHAAEIGGGYTEYLLASNGEVIAERSEYAEMGVIAAVYQDKGFQTTELVPYVVADGRPLFATKLLESEDNMKFDLTTFTLTE